MVIYDDNHQGLQGKASGVLADLVQVSEDARRSKSKNSTTLIYRLSKLQLLFKLN
jgi:hypothetical protein